MKAASAASSAGRAASHELDPLEAQRRELRADRLLGVGVGAGRRRSAPVRAAGAAAGRRPRAGPGAARSRRGGSPGRSVPSIPNSSATADLPGIRQALNAARHLLENYRRQLSNATTQRTLGRLDKRLLAVTTLLDQLTTVEK